MKMSQSLQRVLSTIVFIILNIINPSISFPTLSDKSPDTLQSDSINSVILSALNHHRSRRDVSIPLSTMMPKMAPHYSVMVHRSFAPVRKPILIYPIFYHHPSLYVSRVPRYNSYLTPKSELFTTGDGVGNYINNILPIFNKETPKVKVDPAPVELPAIPSAPIDGKGVPGINTMNPNDPLNAAFPFWNQQAPSWVWPDRIVTGKLPKADVVMPPLFELNRKTPVHRDIRHPAPSEPVVVGVADNALPPFALSGGIDPQLVDRPAVISTNTKRGF